jgi:NADH-quinone oxidoreductase subunit I
MKGFIGYFIDIFATAKSLVTGLSVTFKHIKSPSLEVTQQYPEEKREPYDGYRGRLIVNIEKCLGCSACVRACPIDSIELETVRGKDKKLKPVHFNIDMARCMQCGLCIEACPTKECLIFTKDYEFSSTSREGLVYKFGLIEAGLWEKEKQMAEEK